MIRAAYFALVGVNFFLYWQSADPSFEASDKQDDWNYVLWFSASIFSLAVAIPLVARMVETAWAVRASLVVAAGATLGSAANIVEDGLKHDWAFFGFVVGLLIMLLGLAALVLVIARDGRGRERLLATVPLGVIAAFTFFVYAGGPLMLATWLGASALAALLSGRIIAKAPVASR